MYTNALIEQHEMTIINFYVFIQLKYAPSDHVICWYICLPRAFVKLF